MLTTPVPAVMDISINDCPWKKRRTTDPSEAPSKSKNYRPKNQLLINARVGVVPTPFGAQYGNFCQCTRSLLILSIANLIDKPEQ